MTFLETYLQKNVFAFLFNFFWINTKAARVKPVSYSLSSQLSGGQINLVFKTVSLCYTLCSRKGPLQNFFHVILAYDKKLPEFFKRYVYVYKY